jgi:DNA-binding response OmpR family regulator
MTARDYMRVVIAEDDIDRAREMSAILETIGGYDVWITRRKAEVRGLAAETMAGWLILDLNLEDGNSAELVPVLRKEYGRALFILVLSGYFEDYPEYDLLAGGADFYLRKPYRPKALLQQMETLKARMEGRDLRQELGIKLKIAGGVLDVDRGVYTKGKEEISIPAAHTRLVKLLASARDEHGWQYLERAAVIMHMWGEDFEKDPFSTVERLRKLRTRMRAVLGVEVTEVKIEGRRHLPSYRLSDQVVLVEAKAKK